MLKIIAEFIYTRIINNCSSRRTIDKIIFIVFFSLRKLLLNIINPTIYIKVRGQFFHLPFSHNLPYNCAKYKHYDSLIERVSIFIRNRYSCLTYVDVGANIGDTIAFAYLESNKQTDSFLGIEGNSYFFSYANRNLEHFSNIKLLQIICSSSNEETSYESKIFRGSTASIINNSSSKTITKTLDSILNEHLEYKSMNFLKIDTDGHDFEVIKGAMNTIKESMPVMLIECDVFDNENYINDISFVIDMFQKVGYENILLYDNYGYLFGKFPLNELSALKYPLFYQLISDFDYFDILVMKEEDLITFLPEEVQFFIHNLDNDMNKRIGKMLNF